MRLFHDHVDTVLGVRDPQNPRDSLTTRAERAHDSWMQLCQTCDAMTLAASYYVVQCDLCHLLADEPDKFFVVGREVEIRRPNLDWMAAIVASVGEGHVRVTSSLGDHNVAWDHVDECIRPRHPTPPAEINAQLRADLQTYGSCFARRRADGTVERLDPTRVTIHYHERPNYGGPVLAGFDVGESLDKHPGKCAVTGLYTRDEIERAQLDSVASLSRRNYLDEIGASMRDAHGQNAARGVVSQDGALRYGAMMRWETDGEYRERLLVLVDRLPVWEVKDLPMVQGVTFNTLARCEVAPVVAIRYCWTIDAGLAARAHQLITRSLRAHRTAGVVYVGCHGGGLWSTLDEVAADPELSARIMARVGDDDLSSRIDAMQLARSPTAAILHEVDESGAFADQSPEACVARDPALRSIAESGVRSLRQNLLALPGVTRVEIEECPTDDPPTLAVLVDGGDDAAIAQCLHDETPLGVELVGECEETFAGVFTARWGRWVNATPMRYLLAVDEAYRRDDQAALSRLGVDYEPRCEYFTDEERAALAAHHAARLRRLADAASARDAARAPTVVAADDDLWTANLPDAE